MVEKWVKFHRKWSILPKNGGNRVGFHDKWLRITPNVVEIGVKPTEWAAVTRKMVEKCTSQQKVDTIFNKSSQNSKNILDTVSELNSSENMQVSVH